MLEEVPSELERQLGVARRTVTGVYSDAQARVQGVVSRWIGVEQAVESESLHDDFQLLNNPKYALQGG